LLNCASYGRKGLVDVAAITEHHAMAVSRHHVSDVLSYVARTKAALVIAPARVKLITPGAVV
jgi:hypothetical protein